MIENAQDKYGALKRFAEAYHDLRVAGVDFTFSADEGSPARQLDFFDYETKTHLAEYTTADFLRDITGQVIDEFTLSSDAFPWIYDEEINQP